MPDKIDACPEGNMLIRLWRKSMATSNEERSN